MKKFTAILFSAFYLLATVGVAFNVHHCSGQVGGINVYAKATPCCCGDEEEDMKDCCDDEQFFFQIDQDQQITQNLKVSTQDFFSTISGLVCYDIIKKSEDDTALYKELKIPNQHKQPAWLLHCSLTYYG